jgi:hypothetical protein
LLKQAAPIDALLEQGLHASLVLGIQLRSGTAQQQFGLRAHVDPVRFQMGGQISMGEQQIEFRPAVLDREETRVTPAFSGD